MSERAVKVRLSAQVSEYEAGMLAAARATASVGTEAEKLQQKRQAFEQVGQGLVLTGAALTAVTALSVKAAMGWESAWAGVTKTVDGTDEQLAAVEDGLRGLTGELPAAHDEIAAVAEAAGQLGVQTENVVGFTKTMIDLGETTNLSANDAATALARFMNIMGTSQSQVSNLGSALVGLGNNYATTESEILEMSMRLAGAGKQIGLSEGDVLGLATALSSVGIEAEAGGSAMSKVMIDIAASVEDGGDRLGAFAKVAGVSANDFAAKWKSEPSAAIALFVKGLANAESQGSSAIGILSELGITEVRMRDALLRSSAAADQFSAAMEDGNAAFNENNALTAEAEKRYATVESKIAIAGNAVRDAAIDFGDVFLPAVGAAADGLSEFSGFLGDLPDPVQGIIGVLGAGAGTIALAGGTALLAVPKIAEFKQAFQTLQWSMGKFSLIGGGVVAALVAIVAVVGAVTAAHAEAEQRAQSYADALEAGGDAARKVAADAATAEKSFLWLSRGTAADAAERLGLSLELVGDAVTGTPEALDEVNAALDKAFSPAHTKAAKDLTQQENEAAAAAQELRVFIDEQSAAYESGTKKLDQKNKMTADSVDTSETAAEAYKGEADAVSTLNEELTDLIDTINEANGIAQDAETANARWHAELEGISAEVQRQKEAYEQLNETLDGFGLSLDRSTESGSANRAMLADVASAAQDAAKAQFEQDKATMSSKDAADKYYQTLVDQRQAFIDAAIEAGFSGDAVNELAAAVFALPDETEMTILAETDTAEEKLRLLKQRLDEINGVTYKNVELDSFTVGNFDVDIPGQATGGPVIGPGTGTSDSVLRRLSNGEHVLTAAEVAAAGGHGAVESWRSDVRRGVWMESAGRSGYASPAPAAEQAPVQVTVKSKGGIDLLQYVDVQVERAESDMSSTLRGF